MHTNNKRIMEYSVSDLWIGTSLSYNFALLDLNLKYAALKIYPLVHPLGHILQRLSG